MPTENTGAYQPARHRVARAVRQAKIVQTGNAWESASTSFPHALKMKVRVKMEGRRDRGNIKAPACIHLRDVDGD